MRRSRMRPKPLGLEHLHREHDQHLGRLVLPAGAARLIAVGDGQVGLVDLDHALQSIAIGPHHRPAKPMQHRPGGLVAAQPEHPLQPQGADALLLVGQVPGRSQPDPKRGAGLVEDRARRSPCSGAPQSLHIMPDAAGTVRLARHAAARADEAVRPAQSLQVAKARLFAARTSRGTRSRCVDKVDWTWPISWIFIQCIPLLLELSGYPLCSYSLSPPQRIAYWPKSRCGQTGSSTGRTCS